MAFVFTVEDGTGLSGSNAYVSVNDALDLIFTDTDRYTVLNAATQDEKEAALALASTYLDTRMVWNGSKTVSASAMRWPRTSMQDVDGIAIDKNTLPKALLHAAALMASFIIGGSSDFSVASSGSSYPLQSLKVDVIELDYAVPEDSVLEDTTAVPDEVKLLLKSLGAPAVAAAMFARIVK